MIRPLILAALRPYRIAALRWLDQNAIDLLCAVQALLTPEVEIRVAEVCRASVEPTGPGIASTSPAEWTHGEMGGVEFRRPPCGECGRPVTLKLYGDEARTQRVTFICEHCEAAEGITFDEPVEDAVVAELLSMARPFSGEKPS